eukprot:465102-Pelagomonas_calceolata.AAC.2
MDSTSTPGTVKAAGEWGRRRWGGHFACGLKAVQGLLSTQQRVAGRVCIRGAAACAHASGIGLNGQCCYLVTLVALRNKETMDHAMEPAAQRLRCLPSDLNLYKESQSAIHSAPTSQPVQKVSVCCALCPLFSAWAKNLSRPLTPPSLASFLSLCRKSQSATQPAFTSQPVQ